ncbi:beta-lactamase/transpeptidase-like protein [Mrakia frigida]|uniref:serine hydrolase domain-containing protein n=1 Tax=Mrakia frigida TaxID=29902 RepID=UPI003FCC0B6D
MPALSLSSSTKAKLDAILEKAALELPGCFFTVVSAKSVLYSNRTGRFDVLKPAGPGNEVDESTVLCFFSTTKLLTSVAILQLIDRGLLTLDTPEITIATLLNQSSGFGAEFGPKVSAWKKQAENLFEPLGITDTTFYPHRTPEFKERVMPLRFWDEEKSEFQLLTNQFDGLKLPRETEDIEYPVAGGGIYTSPSSYASILQSLLRDYTSPSSNFTPTLGLSPSSLASLFKGTLSNSALPGLASVMGRMSPQSKEWKSGDSDWTTGLCLWNKRKTGEDGKEWGHLEGFCGWGGAGNTMMGIDPKAGIALVWSSNFLPPNETRAKKVTLEMEMVLYEGLGL